MELSKEVIEANKFSEDQVVVINKFGTDAENILVADKAKEFETTANDNAQKIIDGAIGATMKKTGHILARNEGEKNADFLARYNDSFLEKEKAGITTLKADLEKKIKEGDVSAEVRQQLSDATDKIKGLQEKEASYDKLIEDGVPDKAKALALENLELKEGQAFGSIKPLFPETVNTFEADTKWKDFVNGIKKDYKIELVDDEYKAVSKENEFKIVPLKDLRDKDGSIKALMTGRKQDGPGAKTPMKEIDGLPFQIPENATGAQRAAAIEKHIAEVDKIPVTDRKHSALFESYNKKALGIKDEVKA